MDRKYLLPVIALLIIGMALGTSFLAAGSSRPITVNGEAKLAAMPDRARVILGVQADGATARVAQEAAAKRMNAVFAAMRRAGLAERNIKTVSVSLESIREYDPKSGRERRRGYRASNRIQLTLLDPGKVGTVIDSAVAAGANDVAEIAYYLDDPGALHAKALANALRDARRRADALAAAAGLRIQAAVSLNEQAVNYPQPMETMFRAAKLDEANSTPVSPGQYAIQAHVRVRFSAK